METNSKTESDLHAADFGECVRRNQEKLRADLKPRYDFIVCGSGSSGSVVAGRLAENANVSVLLLEAGGDDVPSVTDADKWPLNLGTELDWSIQAHRTPISTAAPFPCLWERCWALESTESKNFVLRIGRLCRA
jgi:choline dehydrogenase